MILAASWSHFHGAHRIAFALVNRAEIGFDRGDALIIEPEISAFDLYGFIQHLFRLGVLSLLHQQVAQVCHRGRIVGMIAADGRAQ